MFRTKILILTDHSVVNMSPRTEEQLASLKDSKRKLIFDAALNAFSERGYHGATVGLIAEMAGISKGLMYSYFKSKEDLLDELLVYGLTRMGEFLSFVPKEGISTPAEFEAALRGMIGLYTAETNFWRLYIIIVLQKNTTPKFEKLMEEMIQGYLGIFITYFKHRGVPNPLAEAMMLGSVLDGIMFDLMVAPDMYPVEDVIKLTIKKFA